MTGEEPMDSKEWQEWRAARDELAIANERGDAWRDKFHADTNRIAELETALAFYAAPDSWKLTDNRQWDESPATTDLGGRARAALGSPETP